MNAAAITPLPAAVAAMVAQRRATFAGGRTRPRAWRDAQLARLDDLLREQKDELAAALHADLGKSAFEAWLTELSVTRKEIAHTRRHLAGWMKPERVATPLMMQPGRSRILREPLGVVLVLAPWNYPLLLALQPLVSALAAGNCVVLKPSELAPATSAAIARLLPRYLDNEAVTVVEGGIPEATALLEQRFDHIFYTGNGTVGRVVMAAAARHLTPVTLELGGKSPTIVDASANLEVAARRIVWAKFVNAGQTCLAPDHVLVERSVERALCDQLTATIRAAFGDDPRQSPDFSRIVNQRHHRRLVALLASGEIVCGGQHDEAAKYLAPTVLRGVLPDAPIMREEIFGPILPVLAVDSVDAAIDDINSRDKPLALYIFSERKHTARRVLERTSSGGACVNDAVLHYGVHGLPFGGVGESGMGAYHGRHGFETFSHRKALLARGTSLDVPVRYPPYTQSKQDWIKRLI